MSTLLHVKDAATASAVQFSDKAGAMAQASGILNVFASWQGRRNVKWPLSLLILACRRIAAELRP
jgi:hypothetical protein